MKMEPATSMSWTAVMRRAIQCVADLAVIALCVLVGVRALGSTRSPDASVYAAGERLEGLPADALQGQSAIVLAVSSACSLCTESMPFYRRLLAARPAGSPVRVVAWTYDAVEQGEAYLHGHGVHPDRVVAIDRGRARLRGTPTVLLVDGRGSVEAVWEGVLSQGQEEDVLARAFGDR